MQINTQSFGASQAHSDSIEQRDHGSVTHGQEAHLRPQEIKKYLHGAPFPANKSQLVEYAEQQNAPSQLTDMLRNLYGSEFDSPEARLQPIYHSLDELVQHIVKVQ